MKANRSEADFMQQLIALCAAEGMSQLTIAQIASRLQCSRRRLYELAPTKEALFLDVSRRMLDSVVQTGHAAAKREPDLPKGIHAYLHVGAISAARLSAAFLTDLDATDEGRRLFDDYQLARAYGLERLIDAGVQQGLFAPHDWRVVAQAILGASQRLRRPSFLAEAGLSLEEAFEALYELMLHGLMFKPCGGPARGATRRVGGKPAASSAAMQRPRPPAKRRRTIAPAVDSQQEDAAEQIERALEKMAR